MKTIDLAQTPVSVDELLNSAREECVVVRARDGATFLPQRCGRVCHGSRTVARNQQFLERLDSWKQDRRDLCRWTRQSGVSGRVRR